MPSISLTTIGLFVAAIRLNASAAPSRPRIFAGSDAGPTSAIWLLNTIRGNSPSPSMTNVSASDPAKIRGLDDAAEAFKRIAATKSPFVVNEIDGIRYLVEILWNAAGKPERSGWYREHSKEDALVEAGKLGGYTFWGLTPFLRTRHTQHVALEPLVLSDPLLQRMLVTIVVRAVKVAGGNRDGALAFQAFLLAPSTQARIRAVPYSDETTTITWVPAGRNNRTAILPRV